MKIPLGNLCFEISTLCFIKIGAEGIHCFMCVTSSDEGTLIKSTVNADAHK